MTNFTKEEAGGVTRVAPRLGWGFHFGGWSWKPEGWVMTYIFSLPCTFFSEQRRDLYFCLKNQKRNHDSKMSGWKAEMWCLWAMPGFSLSPQRTRFHHSSFRMHQLVALSVSFHLPIKYGQSGEKLTGVWLCVSAFFFARLFGVHPQN